jgi:hypothetical protein
MSEHVHVKLTTRTASGTLIRTPAILEYTDGRIFFIKSPFSLKDEIKAMKGARWHGYDDEPRKIWSVDDCQRNRFQLSFLMGEDVYEWFDRDVIEHDFAGLTLNGKPASPMSHQCDLANAGLTYHYQIWGAEMGVGKTLSAQLVIQHGTAKTWWWIGPKTSLPNIRREFKKWGLNIETGEITVEMMTYEECVRRMDEYKPGDPIPQGVIVDESSRCKGATSQRTRAVQMLADLIREFHGFDGYVIEMSGTPSPKSPVDWWAQCEIAWPGFLKEGSPKALEQRTAFVVMQEYESGRFPKRIGWKDDEKKCATCGVYREDGPHELDGITDPDDYHDFVPSVNEVALMHERLQGLVVIKHKKDCLTLPEKRYRKVICKPTSSVLRVAQALSQAAPNTITGMTWLRELSDGFQYKDVKDGTSPCPHCEKSCGEITEWFIPGEEDRTFKAIDMLDEELVSKLEKRSIPCPRCEGKKVVDKMVRISREVPCPKEKALKLDLEKCEETGRIVIFAGFTGSVDRIAGICRKEGWAVVRCDGRGFEVTVNENNETRVIASGGDDALAYWADLANNPRVAFVAHPESGGMSLTLVESRMCVFWSNSFKGEYRSQAEDRVHRKGMDENLGCEIVDYVHLPTDDRVIEVIQSNRKLELMTMGEMSAALNEDVEATDDDTVVETLAV